VRINYDLRNVLNLGSFENFELKGYCLIAGLPGTAEVSKSGTDKVDMSPLPSTLTAIFAHHFSPPSFPSLSYLPLSHPFPTPPDLSSYGGPVCNLL
jgi:hypothetical protein